MKYLLNKEETERLKFRLLVREDFDTWLKLFQDREIADFLGFGKIPTPKEQCEEWFRLQEKRYGNDLGGMNVLIEKETGKFVGQCGLLVQEVGNKMELEIGYSILSDFRNKGFASEAAQKCRDFAFENNYSESLISIIHVNNISSQRVAIKNGMTSGKNTVYKEMPVSIFRIDKKRWLSIKKK